MVLIKKNHDTIWLCELQKTEFRDCDALPKVDDIFNQVGQAKYITTLDLAKGCW